MAGMNREVSIPSFMGEKVVSAIKKILIHCTKPKLVISLRRGKPEAQGHGFLAAKRRLTQLTASIG